MSEEMKGLIDLGWFGELPDDETCSRCDGEGYVVADCVEDSCCCEDPDVEHGSIPCPLCGKASLP